MRWVKCADVAVTVDALNEWWHWKVGTTMVKVGKLALGVSGVGRSDE